ncbi:MAG: DUF2089 family protein [bacterium]
MDLKILSCPSCRTKMVISELKCPECDLRVKKDFLPCEFCQLSEQDHEFLKIFLRAQGRITDIEKLLGMSYPTIKTKIEKLLTALKLSPIQGNEDPIEALAQGNISVDEAVTILKQRRKK